MVRTMRGATRTELAVLGLLAWSGEASGYELHKRAVRSVGFIWAPARSQLYAVLKRLEADGLIERGPRKAPLLTRRGRAEAERVVRHHRVIERFLTDFMGYSAAESHVHADELGDAFSDEMVERLAQQLGNPDRCPHGWPVDTSHEQEENRDLRPLAAVESGKATIVRLAEHDGDLLHWFYEQGLVPGTEVEVMRSDPAAGQLTIAVDGAERAIGDRAAAGLYVLPG